jgi:DNA-directed RNA polymerase specialized sigma24 family protein
LGLGTEEVPEPNLDGEGLIQYLLSTLSLEHREMVVLCILEESSVVEVSEILGINVNTAYTRLRVAKHELRLSYEKYQRLTEAP